jgi:glycosyltransferase involved in cell wall biosynthesis
MDLSNETPIKINTIPIPNSALVCTFKIKGTKEKVKVDVGLYIHHRNMANSIDIISSLESVNSDSVDKTHILKFNVPKYDIQKRVDSYILIFLHPPLSFNTKIQVEEIQIDLSNQDIHISQITNDNTINNKQSNGTVMDNNFNTNSKVNVVCEGLMLGHSGFAKAMRNVTYNLDKIGCNVKSIILDGDSIKSTQTITGARIMTLARNNSVLTAPPPKFWITMNIPLGVAPHPGYYNIPYIMFETVDYPPEFVAHVRKIGVSEIWTPSNFCRDSMIAAGLTDKIITVMPLGVDIEMFSRENADEPRYIPGNLANMAGKYKFLTVMGYSNRKGVDILVRAFAEEFGINNGGKDADKVILYLKGGWYELNKAQNEINNRVADIPNARNMIHLDFNIYPDDVLASLYKACDCFVLPSKGEGWNLPVCEAMSMEMPTISTRWSAMIDFMNDENSYLINIDGFATDPTCNWITTHYVNRKFAVPSKEHLKQLLRYVYEHREESKAKGKIARTNMVNNYNWQTSCNRMKDRLQTILAGK